MILIYSETNGLYWIYNEKPQIRQEQFLKKFAWGVQMQWAIRR